MSLETLRLKLAGPEDEEASIQLIKELYDYSGYSSVTSFSEQHIRETFKKYLHLDRTELCVMLLRGPTEYGGILIGILQPSHIDPREKIANELVFWVREKYNTHENKRKLLKAFKYWSKLVGATAMSIGKIKAKGSFEEVTVRRIS